MAPDTPGNIPGNGQYYFLTRVRPHDKPLRLRLEWPQDCATDLPGFYYPGNENFGSVLEQVCFSSEDREHWEAIEEAERTADGVELQLKPANKPVYVSVGIPCFSGQLDRLVMDLSTSAACKVEEIGRSRHGRPVNGILFEPEEGVDCKGLFILQAYQHHTEWAGLHALDALMRGFAVGRLDRGGFAWAFVPCLNVDALYGGWREDLMHTDAGNGKCGNLNRDWADFEYPETRAASEFYSRLSDRWPVLHAIDIHMGWSSPERSGGGLTVFQEGSLPETAARHEAAFTRHFFRHVPIEPFAWEVTHPERSNCASWIWNRFGVIGQTLEVSRFRAFDRQGQPHRTSLDYYRGLGPAVAESLVGFYKNADMAFQPLKES